MTGDTDDDKEVREEFRAMGWDGRCRLWSGPRCNRGANCKGGGVFRSPITTPTAKMRPQGFRDCDREIDTCPGRLGGRYAASLRRFWDWKVYGDLPEPGKVGDQCAWTMSALGILSAEHDLITLAQEEERRALMGIGDG